MRLFHEYWNHYGGMKALSTSRYLWMAITLTLFCFNIWSDKGWTDLVIEIIPSMLGFSLGGYAIFLAFGDQRFHRFAAEQDEDGRSVYVEASATFFHFILLQVSALTMAVVIEALPLATVSQTQFPDIIWQAQSYAARLGSAFAFCLFVYAIVSALATSAAIFKLSLIYHQWLLTPENQDPKHK